ncbi:MAG: EAL domain-containing protein, partial [Proteobacteria bacterium]|nr:EAL domain-containing protein [Pseudomonadota bacterium]
VHINLFSSAGERIGYICLLDTAPRPGLTVPQRASLQQIAALVAADRKREQRYLHVMHVADRAIRIDGLLRIVSDAPSCADALRHVLTELCVFHGAALGRVWLLAQPNAPLLELCSYQESDTARSEADPPDDTERFMDATIEAIRRNQPQTVHPPRQAPHAAAAGEQPAAMGCYLCVPIWVQQQRFGIGLTFNTETWDLDLVAADISALATAIRPTLFRKINEERIRFAAHHDDLTRLSNRAMFQDRLRQALAVARSGGHGFALHYLDLDGFKRVNDTRGHAVGDELLVNVAERLRSCVRETDTIARIGGDEFAILQPFDGDPAIASGLAERLLKAIAAPFHIAGAVSLVGVSIGVALYPQDGGTPDALMRHADVALYRAKQAGRNTFRLYSLEPHGQSADRAPIELELHDAIERNQMSLAFQPVCAAASLRITGFEALLRWDHPSLGPIEPERFIPLAESTGLITRLGSWMLEAACTEAARWLAPVTVSVNLSPAQLRQPDLPDRVADILARTGFPASRLQFEVTEGLLLDDPDLVLRAMAAIQAQGVDIVLDDFGTGYAGLGYLYRFPFQGLKIDKSLVRNVSRDRVARTIVESILTLGDRLDLAIAAEGVESEDELATLRALGCRFVQGYFVGRPCSAHNTFALLLQSGTEQAARQTTDA